MRISRCFTTIALGLNLLVWPGIASGAPFAALSQLSGDAVGTLTSPSIPASKSPGAMVSLDKRDLFTVFAPSESAAQDRAAQVRDRLGKALRSAGDGPVPTATTRSMGQSIVVALSGKPLLTVTDLDTRAYGLPAVELGEQWASTITSALTQAQRERRPGYLKDALIEALILLAIGALLHILVSVLVRRRNVRLGWPANALIWLLVAHFIMETIPRTRPIDALLTVGSLRPLSVIIVVGLSTLIVTRLLDLSLERLFPRIPPSLSFDSHDRAIQRRATLGVVARVTSISVVWVISLVTAMSWAGVNISALLASAGLIGVGIGLAAQDTFKDIVAGINILADDRYGVGDYVQIGEYEGTVENVNLRITQIRDMAGNLITFPNHLINAVSNQTQRWAQVDLKIGVSYEADLREAIDKLKETAVTLSREWRDQILADPVVLGVDAFTESNVMLRVLMKTAPGDQWSVARELRLRLKEAFDNAGIAIVPQSRSIIAVSRGTSSTGTTAHGDGPKPNGAAHKPRSESTAEGRGATPVD